MNMRLLSRESTRDRVGLRLWMDLPFAAEQGYASKGMRRSISVTKTTRPVRNPAVVVVGALTSLTLHALLLAPILFGGGNKTHTPDALGSALADRPGSDGALIVELIEESDSASKASASAPQIAPLPTPSAAVLRAAAAELVPSFEIADIETQRESQTRAEAQGDETARARLYGIYVGQISARIERAWLKPRSSPGADQFECRVQVMQDQTGQVQKVTLMDCNGSERWQSSLVSAIKSASPLPAPPDPRVFKRRIAMQFSSEGFVAGGTTEGFEPEVRTAMNNAERAPSVDTGPSDVLEQLRSMRNGKAGAVDLRIGGSPGAADTQMR
jgi:hypothetical protein